MNDSPKFDRLPAETLYAVASALKSSRVIVAEFLESMTDNDLLLWQEALTEGQPVESVEPERWQRMTEQLAAPTILAELVRRLEVRELEAAL